MAPWGPEWHYDRFGTFKERFEQVKYACKVSISIPLGSLAKSTILTCSPHQHSKSIVNGLMSENFAQRLAAAPLSEYKASRTQQRKSKRRNC